MKHGRGPGVGIRGTCVARKMRAQQRGLQRLGNHGASVGGVVFRKLSEENCLSRRKLPTVLNTLESLR